MRELKRKYDVGLMFKHNFWPAVEEIADGVGDYDKIGRASCRERVSPYV